uniref:Uncharacterized protein n=1 Tax=Glossina morsitans morsitans TaxID=37546 RepID=A0A1B0FGW9_GLOMM
MITNPMDDFDGAAPPDDTVSALASTPIAVPRNFLIAGSWDSTIRCWVFKQTGNTMPISMKIIGEPILGVCWSDECAKECVASENKVNVWDLISDQQMQVASRDASVTTCHWIKYINYGFLTSFLCCI